MKRVSGRIISRLGPSGTLGFVILVVLVLIALFGPVFAGNPLKMDIPHRLQPPSMGHLMGRDQFGRDISSRIVRGARISLIGGSGVVIIGLGLGTITGVLAAYRGRATGLVLMGLVDLMLALPGILLAIVIAALLRPALVTAIMAAGIINVPYYARLGWGVTQTARLQEYVEAARAAGAKEGHIIRRHILPTILPPAIVQATLGLGNGILTVTALSFLGLGAQPPTPEWGLMMSEAQSYILLAPHMGVFPGLSIMLAVLSFNLIGDGLRDALDPVLAKSLRR